MTVPSAIDQAIAGYDARKDLYGPASRCAAAAAESMRIAAEVLDVAIDARNSVLAVARRTNDEDIVAAVAADAAEASQAAVKVSPLCDPGRNGGDQRCRRLGRRVQRGKRRAVYCRC